MFFFFFLLLCSIELNERVGLVDEVNCFADNSGAKILSQLVSIRSFASCVFGLAALPMPLPAASLFGPSTLVVVAKWFH